MGVRLINFGIFSHTEILLDTESVEAAALPPGLIGMRTGGHLNTKNSWRLVEHWHNTQNILMCAVYKISGSQAPLMRSDSSFAGDFFAVEAFKPHICECMYMSEAEMKRRVLNKIVLLKKPSST